MKTAVLALALIATTAFAWDLKPTGPINLNGQIGIEEHTVPEPGMLGLLALGVIGVIVARRKK